MLPPLPSWAVATCWARSEANRIGILGWVQDPCSCAMIFQTSPVSGHDKNAYDWSSTYMGTTYMNSLNSPRALLGHAGVILPYR